MLMRIQLRSSLRPWRLAFLVLLVAFLLFNRTFLAWSSSGLETAMFDFLLVLWVYAALFAVSAPRKALGTTITAAALALSRPDGLLFCVGSVIITAILVAGESDKTHRRRILLYGLLPLGIVLAHLVWRLSFYGEVFPNTYYAKMTGWWPQSGWRYALSFALEYAVWFAGIFVCWALAGVLNKGKSNSEKRSKGKRSPPEWGTPIVVIGTLALHVCYYTFAVGGDHFEYRVYAQLLPLIFLVLVWSLNRLRLRPSRVITVSVAFVLLSMPVPWTHWHLTKNLNTRKESWVMRVAIAPHWPQPVRWYATLFDDLQSWLIFHHVCMRHQEHKMFWKEQTRMYPTRKEGGKISPNGFPVHATLCVGVPGWVLPRVSVIDMFGLNDYVIARSPLRKLEERLMAHSRKPPRGYVESYRPNVGFQRGQLTVGTRSEPMTAETIAKNERYWRNKLEK
jgi:arabinofuranosyltransferase